MATVTNSRTTEIEYQAWRHWPVNWTAVIVGALSALALSTIFALAAAAVGANELTPENRIVDLHKIGIWVMVIGVFGSFLAFVTGGWVAGRIAGILHSEPAILHGAIVWLCAIPALAVFSAMGVSGFKGTWYSGLASVSNEYHSANNLNRNPAVSTEVNPAEAMRVRDEVTKWNQDTPRATRNSTLFAVTALIIGLLGSVVGGWMASGEPMSLRYSRSVGAI